MLNVPFSFTAIRSALLLAPVWFMAGCATLAPDYQRPDLPVPQTWSQTVGTVKGGSVAQTTSANDAAKLPWKAFFQDARLVQVIQLALENNRNLRQVLADVEAARASYRIQKADLYPTLALAVGGSRNKASSGTITNNFEATGGLSAYEIDLFGKTRSLNKAELEAYLSSSSSLKASQITLIGETASAWLALAADQNLLDLANETAENARKTMEIARKRMTMGVDSRIDLASAETTYYTAQADIATYSTQLMQDRNALSLLVGQTIDVSLLPASLPASRELVAGIPAGLDSSVLLLRPDVLAAEHDLQAANANIGVARAAFFPSLSLTATGGLASSVFADLFSGGASTIWTLAPSVSLPIFDAGANQAQLDYSEAQLKKYVAAYEYAIQTAFSEVADALARRATIQQQLSAQDALVLAAEHSYELSLARYKNGVDSFQDALTSQRTMYAAKQSLISARLSDLDNQITLYRVLGGGLAEDSQLPGSIN